MIRRVATPLPADSQTPLAASRNYLVLTFDDGLSSFAEHALPLLEKYEIPATLFVVVGKLGTVPAWTSYMKGGKSEERMLDSTELRQLGPRVLIGSHGLTHQRMIDLSEADARREITASRTQLESILGRRIALFSFPYGAFNKDLLRYCKDAGYERVFTGVPIPAFTRPDEFVTGRFPVKPEDWPLEFRLKLVGSYRWSLYASSIKRSLSRMWPFRSRRTDETSSAEFETPS